MKRVITGLVEGVTDTTPPGLLDAPRKFIIQVRTGEGKSVEVLYTAYPPSPAAEEKKIRLSLHAGTVRTMDYLEARGTFDSAARRLLVAEPGDYIVTRPRAP